MVPQSDWIMQQVPNNGKPFTVAETFELNRAREMFRSKVVAHWNNTCRRTTTGRSVDAILSPVAPTLAPPHDTTRWWGYTSYWNLMDFPAVVFPTGRFRAHDNIPFDVSGEPVHGTRPRSAMEEYIKGQWAPETYDNAPVALQLIGRRLDEERLLGILSVVEQSLHHSHG